MHKLVKVVGILSTLYTSGCIGAGSRPGADAARNGILEQRPFGERLVEIQKRDQTKVAVGGKTKTYYLVAGPMHYPLTDFYYEDVANKANSGRGTIDPPLERNCFESDTGKCAREGKWRRITTVPCDVDLEINVFAVKDSRLTWIGGTRRNVPCSLEVNPWDLVTN